MEKITAAIKNVVMCDDQADKIQNSDGPVMIDQLTCFDSSFKKLVACKSST